MSLEAFPIVAQSVQTQNLVDLSLSGNTAGALALMSSGTVTIAGGNNVTLSQAGNAFTISAFNQSVQTQNNVDVTLAGNTSGALALVSSGTLTIAGGNNITMSQAGNAVTISGPNTVAQSVQTQNVVDVTLSGNTSGALALISSGTMTLAGGNNITLSQAGNAVTISGAASAAQTVQTQNLFDLTLSGNTSGTLALVSSGTLTLAGGNNVTLSQVGNAVTISAFNQSVQTQNVVDVTLAGNTSGVLALASSGTLTLAGGNNITLSQAGNAVTISAFSQTVQTQSLGSNTLGMSNLGNTSGTTGVVSGSNVLLALAGGNNITLSQSINGSSATITISAFSQTVQTQNVVDVTLAGNTSGALALVSSGTLTLAGGNNITLSQAGNAVTISGGAGGGNFSAGISTLGNTAGTTGLVGSQVVFVGGSNVTLSQSVNAQSATISVNAAPVLSFWQNRPEGFDFFDTTHGKLHLFPLVNSFFFPGNMTVSTARLHMSCNMSVTSASSQAHTYTVYFGIYTFNANTLSLFNSASTTFGSNNTNRSFSTMYNGFRFLTFNSSQWSNSNLSLAFGSNYVGAVVMLSSGTNHAFRFNAWSMGSGQIADGTIGTSGAGANTNPWLWIVPGFYTSTTSNLPASIGTTQIDHAANNNQYVLDLQFDNQFSAF